MDIVAVDVQHRVPDSEILQQGVHPDAVRTAKLVDVDDLYLWPLGEHRAATREQQGQQAAQREGGVSPRCRSPVHVTFFIPEDATPHKRMKSETVTGSGVPAPPPG